MDDFWLEEDREEFKRITSEADRLSAESLKLTEKIKQSQAENPEEPVTELLEERNRINWKLLDIDYTDELEALHKKVEQRYIDSYADNPKRILNTISEVLQAYTKEDFIATQEARAKTFYALKDDITAPEIIPMLEKNIKQNYQNCCSCLYVILRIELNALAYYDMPIELGTELIQAKARTFYPKRTPKKKLDLEELNNEIKLFHTIRQGNTTNTLAKFGERDMEIDEVTHKATFKKGEITLEIPNYDKIRGLKTSTQQLLDIICITLTESGAKSPTVSFPLEEYMLKRGLKDRKEARNQVKADLELLQQANIKAEQRKRGNTVYYEFINIADSGKIDNGFITFTFGTSFYNMLLSYPVMPYPAKLLQINGKRNPNSSPFGRKIAEHKNMNVGKANENIIAVKTLLEVGNLPTKEEVMRTDKHLDQRIIKPFERDLDALSDIFKWHYCHTNGSPLSDNELPPNYETFKDLLIFIEWNEYPDQTERLKRKRERIEQGKKKKTKKANK